MTGVIIGSSLLIVLVAVLRRLLRGRVSARLIYALWGLVLLRLLVPFSPELGLPSAEAAAREVYERTELSEAMLPYERVTAPYAAGQSRGVLPEDDPIQPYIDAGEPAPEYRVELHNEGTPEAETEFVFLRPWTEVLSGYVRPIWLAGTLTALALLASYVEEIRIGLLHNGVTELLFTDGTKCLVEQASILDFMSYYNVSLMNPTVLVGVFIGAMMSFLFCGLTMNAVGRAAESMVQEVRRQFREIKGILTGEGTPDYARCVAISTRGAQREMLFPSLLAIIVPVVVGLVFGVAGVMGLLVGGLGSGFVLAVFMANSGGAWDNAKKLIEEGNFGGKGSECHKATVVGDTVGDPFKDTSGPSLNILIKLMSMVSIVMAGLTVAWHLF